MESIQNIKEKNKKMQHRTFWLPTKPYDLTDAINRAAAATGSPTYAAKASAADYNGHRISLCWNDYRSYYVGEFWWAGRMVVARGRDFSQVLERCKEEYNKQGKGACLHVHPQKEDLDIAINDSDLKPWSRDIETTHNKSWMNWKYFEIGAAMWQQKHYGVPISYLIEAKTHKEYDEMVKEHLQKIREKRKTI